MFHHVKELQFNARVSEPDVRFARLLLEQFGGPNGELKAAMQYFVQAFGCRKPNPDVYLEEEIKGTERTEKSVQKNNKSLSADRKAIVEEATLPGNGVMSWSVYEEEVEAKSSKSKNNK